MRILTGLLLLWGATFLIVGQAQAVTLSPEAQQYLDDNGLTASDTESDVWNEMDDPWMKTCPVAGRAKRIGFNYGNQVRLSQRLKVCAANGKVTYSRCGTVRYASPGTGWKNTYGPWLSHGGGRGYDWSWCQVKIGWESHGVIQQFWDGQVKIQAKVNHQHDIFFPVKRRLFE